jgi:DNA-binding response OmpR family regulator
MAKILIIEDEAPMRKLVGEFLRLAGYETVTASNGVEGMELAKEIQFDLVITDIIMPEKEGIEVIMDLRRQQPGLRIIAMSGGGRLSADDCLKLARKLGAKATLAKPFSGAELLAAVAAVLGAQESPTAGPGAA